MDGQNMEKKATLTSFILNDKLTELIEAFPAVDFAFAYGSGVIQQQVLYPKRQSRTKY